MSAAFYIRYAWRALQRGGQRSLLALLCVAFGVMSLVGMQLLAGMITSAVIADPRAILGGDAQLRAGGEGAPGFTAAQIADLEHLRTGGALRAYSLTAQQPVYGLKPPGTGQIYLLTRLTLGVDPATYPLVGAIPLRAPAGTTFGAAIAPPLSVVVTRDLADQLGLKIGDHITLIGDPSSPMPALQITGIAQDVPNRQGDGVFYSLDTARRIAGRDQVVTNAAVLWGPGGEPTAQLKAGGWSVERADDLGVGGGGNVATVFDFMLKGAGILGLIVGGIGVANTLQVSLARRTLEIAALKTLGYRRRDLLLLFGIETALLGVAGGLIGAAAGVGLASVLVTLLGNTSLFLLPWLVDWRILAGGVGIGALTAVIFGLFTIVRASSVRPAVLLRSLPVACGWRTGLASLALLALLLVLFTAISILVMGSPVDGAGVVGAALAALIALTLGMGGTLFVLLRLPAPRLGLLTLARQNLKRQMLRALFPLIALFMGIFTIGFATGTLLNAFNRVSAQQTPLGGYNLAIYGRQADAVAISGALAHAGVTTVHASVRVPVSVETAAGAPLPSLTYLDGRVPADVDWDTQVTAGTWPGAADGALLPDAFQQAPWSLQIGEALTITPTTGPTTTLHIAGFYTARTVDSVTNVVGVSKEGSADGVLVGQDTVARLGGPTAPGVFVAAVPAAQLPVVEAALGPALPQAIVLSKIDLSNALQRRYVDLLAFVNAVAGLALLAGVVLIANGIGLALIERRREMGILKAVGFTAGRVLGALALENALLGLLGGVFGMVAVALAMAYINAQRPAAQLSLDPLLAVGMIAVAVALTTGTTVLVAWGPTHNRPLDVLRTE